MPPTQYGGRVTVALQKTLVHTAGGRISFWPPGRMSGLVLGVAAAGLLLLAAGCGPEPAPVQSELRPYNFPVAAPVQQAASDGASRRFQRRVLPDFIRTASEKFNKATVEAKFPELVVDPGRLRLAEGADVRVYFVGEASGYLCSLGINTEGIGPEEGKPRYVFPSKDTATHLYDWPARLDKNPDALFEGANRTQETPLFPGDFVDLGYLRAGTPLEFFLVANNRRAEIHVYTAHPEFNPDNVQHMVAVAVEDSPYLLFSFEDMYGGGDKDYSDCVFAVHLSGYNVQALLGRIDPLRQFKRLLFIWVPLGLVVAGPMLWFAARAAARRRRLRRAREEAEAALRGGNAQAAAERLREVREKEGARRASVLTDLEIEALRELRDVGQLAELHRALPAAFNRHEPASLRVAQCYVATEAFSDYEVAREQWRGRTRRSADWAALDVDACVAQEQLRNARELLKPVEEMDNPPPGLLARLGLLLFPEERERAETLLAQARDRGSRDPEVLACLARVHEYRGEPDKAFKAYWKAYTRTPRDPFSRDRLAAFLRRRGEHEEALKLWWEGLRPPSLPLLWIRFLFWRRVATDYPADLSPWPVPEGPEQPLAEYLLGLPEGVFWDQAAFDAVVQHHPHLAGHQAVFWLRLIHGLARGREEEALSSLNLDGFGGRSWDAPLEKALLRTVTYRRLGFVHPEPESGPPLWPGERHTVFTVLDRWAANRTQPPADMQRLLRSRHVYAALFLAAGWRRAALRLRPAGTPDRGLPAWYARLMAEARRQ